MVSDILPSFSEATVALACLLHAQQPQPPEWIYDFQHIYLQATKNIRVLAECWTRIFI